MHPLFALAAGTFLLFIAFLAWNLLSTKRHRFGRKPTGVGGVNDPLAGATNNLRDPDDMRASMDMALETSLGTRPFAK